MLDPGKFLTGDEAGRLLSVARHRALAAKAKGKKVAVRDYFIVHIALATGLRVMEIASLKCGDLSLNGCTCSVMVWKGKGNKTRRVLFRGSFKKHCEEYLDWKQSIGESLDKEAPLVVSSNTGSHMTTRAMEKVFKRCAENASLQSAYSIHCLRHTYATFMLEASNWNVRFVQKQLGHEKITTTQVYIDVMSPAIRRALDRFPI